MSALARRGDPVRIRPLTTSRLDEVLAIERVCFSDPWSREMFRSELEVGGGTYARFAERDGALIGYLCAVLVEERYTTGWMQHVPMEAHVAIACGVERDGNDLRGGKCRKGYAGVGPAPPERAVP